MPEEIVPEDRVVIGVVVASHGLQGTLKVDLKTDFPERFESLKSCWLCRSDGSARKVSVKRCKFTPRGILLTLEGIKTREEADDLRGATLEIPVEERWPLPEGSFYISDLVGCKAIDGDGNVIGEIEDVIRGSQDVLSIHTVKGEILVPFVDEWVGNTDIIGRSVEIKRVLELIGPEEIPPALGESDH